MQGPVSPIRWTLGTFLPFLLLSVVSVYSAKLCLLLLRSTLGKLVEWSSPFYQSDSIIRFPSTRHVLCGSPIYDYDTRSLPSETILSSI